MSLSISLFCRCCNFTWAACHLSSFQLHVPISELCCQSEFTLTWPLWWASSKLTCGLKVEDLFVWGEICDLWFGVVLRKFFYMILISGKKSYDTNNYTEWSWVSSPGLEFFSREPAGFVPFFDRIQDFLQTIFFIFQAQGNSEILHGSRRNNCLNYKNDEKKIQFQLFSSSRTETQPNNSSILNFYHKVNTSVLKTIFNSSLFQQSPWIFAISGWNNYFMIQQRVL